MYVSIKKCPKIIIRNQKKPNDKSLIVTIKIAIKSEGEFLLFFFSFY